MNPLYDALSKYLPLQYLLVVLLMISAASLWVLWRSKFSETQRAVLRGRWFELAGLVLLVAIVFYAANAYLEHVRLRPLPKADGNLRILVMGNAESPSSDDLSFAVSQSMQQLVDSLHINGKVEIWPLAPSQTRQDLERVLVQKNADAMVWLVAVGPPDTAVLYSTLYVRPPQESVRHIQLTQRSMANQPPHALATVSLQLALEVLAALEPALPDWSDLLGVKTGREPSYEHIVPAATAEKPVDVRLTVYAWHPQAAVVARRAHQILLEVTAEPLTSTATLPSGSPLPDAQVSWDTFDFEVPEGYRACLTYGLWYHNNSLEQLTGVSAELPIPRRAIYVCGMTTVNGTPVPDTGNLAEVELDQNRICFTLAQVPAGHRSLLTATFLLPEWPVN